MLDAESTFAEQSHIEPKQRFLNYVLRFTYCDNAIHVVSYFWNLSFLDELLFEFD
jgi:hypothetical protein